ncbi:hypothetical protein D3C81_2299680 [compost metagenome]
MIRLQVYRLAIELQRLAGILAGVTDQSHQIVGGGIRAILLDVLPAQGSGFRQFALVRTLHGARQHRFTC